MSRRVNTSTGRRLAVALLGLLAGLGASAPARAELEWERGAGAEGCASREDLARELAEHGVDPAVLASRRLAGRVSTDGRGYRAELRAAPRDGGYGAARSVESSGPDCHALTPSLVLVMAMLLEPSEPLQSAPAAAPSNALTAPAPSAAPPRRTYELGAVFAGAIGLVPGLGLGAGATLRLAVGRHGLGALVGVSVLAGQNGRDFVEPRPFHSAAVMVPLLACGDVLRSRWVTLSPCTGLSIGSVPDAGIRSRRGPVVDYTMGLRARVSLTRTLALLLDLSAAVLLKGPGHPGERGFLSYDDASTFGAFVAPRSVLRFQFHPGLALAWLF
jgi:hypothetical protein